jgi:uncharacterized membrane protein
VETNRVEAFSDGVFAIAITLLILGVVVPTSERGRLGHDLLELWPSYVAYGVSFVTIGIIWVNHHEIFRQVGRVDRTLLFINVLFLMLVAFIPFPTRVVADFVRHPGDRRPAALAYGITLTVTALLFNTLWRYVSGKRGLLREDADPRVVSGITRSFIPGVPLYAGSTLLSLVSPIAALVLYGSIALFYVLSSSLFGRDEIGEAAA